MGGACTGSVLHSFTQQVFLQYLLYARHRKTIGSRNIVSSGLTDVLLWKETNSLVPTHMYTHRSKRDEHLEDTGM